MKLIWALLFLSSLPWGNPTREIFIPKRFEQAGTALCLGMAVLLALALNRALRIRGAGFVWLYAGLRRGRAPPGAGRLGRAGQPVPGRSLRRGAGGDAPVEPLLDARP